MALPRFIAFSMVSPRTNCAPISFMARPTAVRITGSPRRFMALRRWPAGPGRFSGSRTLPVSIRAQVEALTSGEVERPMCLPQFEGAILSSISASMVSASGTRSRASARHISAMPSSVERPYSARKTSIMPGLVLPRIWVTRLAARSPISPRSAGESAACSRSFATVAASSA